jgi:Rrf2 family protein
MLRITKAEDQAVRLVMQLASSGEQLTLGQLAEREALPEPTVAKLLGQLRRGGVVEAIRGRHGGYVLGGDPAEITTNQVLRALGSDPAPDHPCVLDPQNGGGDCPRTADCGLRAVWRYLAQQVAGLLEKTTIADLLKVERSVGGQLQQLWPLEEASGAQNDDETGADRALSEGA